MIVLLSLIITTSAFAHEEPKTKLVFGKKCTVNNNTIVTSYVWKVENSNWKRYKQRNCERKMTKNNISKLHDACLSAKGVKKEQKQMGCTLTHCYMMMYKQLQHRHY